MLLNSITRTLIIDACLKSIFDRVKIKLFSGLPKFYKGQRFTSITTRTMVFYNPVIFNISIEENALKVDINFKGYKFANDLNGPMRNANSGIWALYPNEDNVKFIK